MGGRLKRNRSLRDVVSDPNERHIGAFMALPSASWVLYRDTPASLADLRRCAEGNACAPHDGDTIAIGRFMQDGAHYSVNLSKPALMIENEIFFPNWRARICTDNRCGEPLSAVPAGEYLRSWVLPAGKYELRTRYVDPYKNVLIGMFWGSQILLVGFCIGPVLWRRVRQVQRAP